MTKKILVMGLPGAGKTTFSQELVKHLMLRHTIKWFNADAVRKEFNDWDFSADGRLRQVQRMRDIASASGADFAICDFVCPTEDYRKVFDADILIWLDTIEQGRFEDTNKVFEKPNTYTYKITNWSQTNSIIDQLVKEISFDKTESHWRSIVKAISWRVCGTLDTFVLSWIITGQVHLAVAISGLEAATKIVWYWLHERLWNRIPWGRK